MQEPSHPQKTTFSLAPQNLEEAMRFAEIMSKSSIIPKDFANNPGNILVAVQWGMELGLQPMQAMQNIAVINGRPTLWGDAVIGLVRASPLCEYVIEESFEDKAICRVKRRGEDEQLRIFTVDDAKKAGLLGKQGPWTQYPKRMLQMRARSWALRDVFPDVLRGVQIAEEVMDIEPEERELNPRPKRQNAAEIAQQAVSAEPDGHGLDENDKAVLLAELEAVANTGTDALQQTWEAIGQEKRKAMGVHLQALKERAAGAGHGAQ